MYEKTPLRRRRTSNIKLCDFSGVTIFWRTCITLHNNIVVCNPTGSYVRNENGCIGALQFIFITIVCETVLYHLSRDVFIGQKDTAVDTI